MASKRPTLNEFKKKALKICPEQILTAEGDPKGENQGQFSLKDPKFKKEYDALNDEFSLIDEMISARKAAHLTQEDVAKKLHTKQPAIARLESGKLKNITLETLKKYAEVVSCDLEVHLVRK